MPYKNKEDRFNHLSKIRDRNFDNMWKILSENPCVDCGETDPLVLEFDHLPEYEKSFSIGKAVSSWTFSWEKIQTEIDKCEVLCANCHRRRTLKRGNFKRHLRTL